MKSRARVVWVVFAVIAAGGTLDDNSVKRHRP
jgi:hypothetical protein